MEVVILQVFVSLALVVGSLILFGYSCRQRDFDHAERLALLPLEDELAQERTICADAKTVHAARTNDAASRVEDGPAHALHPTTASTNRRSA